jgi:hypothetical protein
VTRRLNLASAVALCILAAGGIATVLIADSYEPAASLAFTAGALLAFGLAAAAGISIVGFPLAWIGWLCVIVSATGFGISMGVIWDVGEESQNEGLIKATGSLFVFSLALGLVSFVLGRVRAGDDRFVATLMTVTLAATLGTAALLTIAIVDEVTDELYYRVTAVVAVLATVGMGLTPLVRALRQST